MFGCFVVGLWKSFTLKINWKVTDRENKLKGYR